MHKALCMEHDIMGFPTLKLFDVAGTESKRYTGKRDLGSLKNFIKENVPHSFGEVIHEDFQDFHLVPDPLGP